LEGENQKKFTMTFMRPFYEALINITKESKDPLKQFCRAAISRTIKMWISMARRENLDKIFPIDTCLIYLLLIKFPMEYIRMYVKVEKVNKGNLVNYVDQICGAIIMEMCNLWASFYDPYLDVPLSYVRDKGKERLAHTVQNHIRESVIFLDTNVKKNASTIMEESVPAEPSAQTEMETVLLRQREQIQDNYARDAKELGHFNMNQSKSNEETYDSHMNMFGVPCVFESGQMSSGFVSFAIESLLYFFRTLAVTRQTISELQGYENAMAAIEEQKRQQKQARKQAMQDNKKKQEETATREAQLLTSVRVRCFECILYGNTLFEYIEKESALKGACAIVQCFRSAFAIASDLQDLKIPEKFGIVQMEMMRTKQNSNYYSGIVKKYLSRKTSDDLFASEKVQVDVLADEYKEVSSDEEDEDDHNDQELDTEEIAIRQHLQSYTKKYPHEIYGELEDAMRLYYCRVQWTSGLPKTETYVLSKELKPKGNNKMPTFRKSQGVESQYVPVFGIPDDRVTISDTDMFRTIKEVSHILLCRHVLRDLVDHEDEPSKKETDDLLLKSVMFSFFDMMDAVMEKTGYVISKNVGAFSTKEGERIVSYSLDITNPKHHPNKGLIMKMIDFFESERQQIATLFDQYKKMQTIETVSQRLAEFLSYLFIGCSKCSIAIDADIKPAKPFYSQALSDEIQLQSALIVKERAVTTRRIQQRDKKQEEKVEEKKTKEKDATRETKAVKKTKVLRRNDRVAKSKPPEAKSKTDEERKNAGALFTGAGKRTIIPTLVEKAKGDSTVTIGPVFVKIATLFIREIIENHGPWKSNPAIKNNQVGIYLNKAMNQALIDLREFNKTLIRKYTKEPEFAGTSEKVEKQLEKINIEVTQENFSWLFEMGSFVDSIIQKTLSNTTDKDTQVAALVDWYEMIQKVKKMTKDERENAFKSFQNDHPSLSKSSDYINTMEKLYVHHEWKEDNVNLYAKEEFVSLLNTQTEALQKEQARTDFLYEAVLERKLGAVTNENINLSKNPNTMREKYGASWSNGKRLAVYHKLLALIESKYASAVHKTTNLEPPREDEKQGDQVIERFADFVFVSKDNVFDAYQ
jgi:hypothetical protein